MPRTLDALREQGLSPETLGHEIQRGRAAGVKTLFAGIELIDLAGMTRLNAAQIAADLKALCDAQPAGLALSWDLWWMPSERLMQVRTIWCGTRTQSVPTTSSAVHGPRLATPQHLDHLVLNESIAGDNLTRKQIEG